MVGEVEPFSQSAIIFFLPFHKQQLSLQKDILHKKQSYIIEFWILLTNLQSLVFISAYWMLLKSER